MKYQVKTDPQTSYVSKARMVITKAAMTELAQTWLEEQGTILKE